MVIVTVNRGLFGFKFCLFAQTLSIRGQSIANIISHDSSAVLRSDGSGGVVGVTSRGLSSKVSSIAQKTRWIRRTASHLTYFCITGFCKCSSTNIYNMPLHCRAEPPSTTYYVESCFTAKCYDRCFVPGTQFSIKPLYHQEIGILAAHRPDLVGGKRTSSVRLSESRFLM